MNDAAAWHFDLLISVPVNKSEVRCETEAGNRTVHGKHCCAENVPFLNLFHGGKGYTPGKGNPLNLRKKLFPSLLGELFGVVQPRQFHLRRENHRGRADRSRKGPSYGLIHTADQANALCVQLPFDFPEIQFFHRSPGFLPCLSFFPINFSLNIDHFTLIIGSVFPV